MKKLIAFFILAFISGNSFAQCHNVLWKDSLVRNGGCNCQYVLNNNTSYDHVIKDDDGNTYASGFRSLGYLSPSGNPDLSFFVRKFNAAGALEWMAEPYYQVTGLSAEVNDIFLDSNKSTYMSMAFNFGHYFRFASFVDSAHYLPGQQGTLMKIDSAGNRLWARGTYGRFSAVNKCGDSFTIGKNDTLEKRDNAGNLLWIKRFAKNTEQCLQIKIDSQSNLIVASVGELTKLDSAGNVLWQINASSFFYHINSNGMALNSSDEIFVTTFTNILKINPAGNVSVFTPPYVQYIKALFINKNDEVIFNGFNNNDYYYFSSSGAFTGLYKYPFINAQKTKLIYADTANVIYVGTNLNVVQGGPVNYFYNLGITVTAAQLTTSNAIAAVSSNIVCQGDTIKLQSIEPGMHTYQWYKNNTLMPGETNQQLAFDSVGTNYFYCVLDGNISCPSNTILAIVQQPMPPPSMTISSINCTYTSLNITGNVSNAYHILYGNGVFAGLSGSSLFNAVTSGVYTLADSNACGIFPAADTLNVQIHVGPMSGIASHQVYFCEGGQVTLTANTGYPYYEWYYPNFSQMGNSITISNVLPYPLQLRIIDSLNCSIYETFTIHKDTVIPLVTTTAQTLCSGDSITINANSGFTSYQWSTGDTTQSISLHNGQWLNISVVDSIGCSGTDSILVNEITLAQPVLYFDSSACILSTDSLANTNYQWYLNNQSLGNNFPYVNADSTGYYQLMVQQNGCTAISDSIYLNCLMLGIENNNFLSQDMSIENPVRSILKIKFRNKITEAVKINIYDTTGRLVKNIEKGPSQIISDNVHDLPQGVYLVSLTIGSQHKQIIKRMIKVD